jgi:5-methylcytosine-specific restriction endonuclease McrA
MAKKKQEEKIDGLSPKDVEKIRTAIRKVWSWSTPRRLCVQRASLGDDYYQCEGCQQKVPKIYVDHKIAVGNLDGGFIERLFTPSANLQALCKKCHAEKTKEERKALKESRQSLSTSEESQNPAS